uniref:protein xylosyltransferase n=1 Tax=Phallusia mammillata TaxID=59560 RepID=A0A6F9DWI8_9ASCI|nr:xylosyltransferase [Phallusia mammillata]
MYSKLILIRFMKRILRKWKLYLYIIMFFLLVQALIALQTNPNLLEEEEMRRVKEMQKMRQDQLAKAMLQGEKSHLAKFEKDGVDIFNPKDPRFREQFLQHADKNTGVLEDPGDKEFGNKQISNLTKSNLIEEIHFEDDELPNEKVKFAPKCEVTLKDAQSAIFRAKSEACKQEIADTACKHQEKMLLPKSMNRRCPHENKFAFDAPMPASFSESLRPVRICFMLVVHGRAFRQFKRLLRVIYHRDHFYYIHVDKRSDYLFREIKKVIKQYPNVVVAPWRMATIWGGSSLLQMLLRSMSDVLRLWTKWDFFINLSALDFPIESDEKLINFLATYRDKNFMKSHGRDDEKFIRKQGLNRLFVECEQHMWRLGERDLPEGIIVNGGSDWVALNREICEYAIRGKDDLLTDLKHWYKYTLLPAESFFHTLVQNSEKCESFVDNNLRVTNWNRARGCKCQYKHIVDWCGCSPNDFYPSDLGRLQTSRPVFFARKFEEIINQEVVNHLDFKIYGKYPSGTPGLNSYWESCYDHADGASSVGDSFLTHYSSFARLGLKEINSHLTKNNPQPDACQLHVDRILQVEMHKQREQFMGYIVTVETTWRSLTERKDNVEISDPDKSVQMQVFVSPQSTLRITDKSSELASRLEGAAVGTNWDVKELTLRDWGGIIGPNSDVHLVARWRRAEEDFVVTVVAIDPLNVVSDYNDFRTPAKAAGVTETPLSLRKPMRPGKWTIRFYVQRQFNNICAEINFFVAPLEFVASLPGGASLSVDNMGIVDDTTVNAASRNLYTMRTTLNLKKDERAAEKLVLNSKYTAGPKLQSWVDDVIVLAWTAKEYCTVAESPAEWTEKQPKSCYSQRQITPSRCADVSWSSFSPDPKSELGRVKSNGRIR